MGIYQIGTYDQVLYIGQSVNVEERLKQHKRKLDKNKHFNIGLQRFYNKHKEEITVWKIVEPVIFRELLTAREIYYIKTLKPRFNFILPDENDRWIGPTKGKNLTEEHKRKIGIANSISLKGLKRSKESIEKSKLTLSKIKRSEEWKKHISEALKGKSFRKGYKLSEEHKRKIGEANKIAYIRKLKAYENETES